MAKKSTVRQIAGEIGEIVKDVGKGLVEEVVVEGGKEAWREISGKTSTRDNKQLEEIRKKDNKKRGPEIARQRQALALQAEEQRAVQQGQQDRREANLEEERRMRQAEKGEIPSVKTPSSRKRAFTLPVRQKASTQEYIPQTAERIKRKAA